jgi:acyl carrier protein
MRNLNDVFNILTPVFQQVFDDPNLVLTEQLSAADIEGWDSLNHISLIVEIESAIGMTFSTDELITLANVGDFAHLILSKYTSSNDKS